MLTRKRWIPPNIPTSLPPELQEYIRNQNRSISEYLLSLEAPDSLTIDEAAITATNGIKFPATQVDSSDVNTLDDYEEGTWTPTITAGTGSFTTVSATGSYTKIGNVVTYRVAITITTNGTAATDVRFTTPFTASSVDPFVGFDTVAGVVLGGYLNGSTGICYTYNSAYPGGSGRVLVIRGVCAV